MNLRNAIKVFLALAALGHRAIAETNAPSQMLTLTDVTRLVGDRNPRVRAEREAIAAARADRRTAGAFPNPKLGFSHQEPSAQQTMFTGEHQESVTIEQPIPIPGQRASRIAKANADIAAVEARANANIATITGDACASFMLLLALQHRTEALSNSLAQVTRLRETITERGRNGAASAYDQARIEVEAGTLAGKFESARAEMAAEASQLASLLAITNGLPSATGALQPLEIPSRYLFDPTAQTAISPAALAAAREAVAAEKGITVARRARWPDLSIEGGRAWTRHPYGAADSIGINLEIPIFDTRRGQLDRAKSEASAAEARKAVAQAEAEATVRQLAEAVQRRQAALERYRTDIEPRLARLKDMATESYLMGRHTLLELLDAEQARREVVLDRIETTSALLEAQIRLLAVTGQLPQFLQDSPTTSQK